MGPERPSQQNRDSAVSPVPETLRTSEDKKTPPPPGSGVSLLNLVDNYAQSTQSNNSFNRRWCPAMMLLLCHQVRCWR